MSYDWTRGYCKGCGKFVRDGQGIQEQIKNVISRFCWKCYERRCSRGGAPGAPESVSGPVRVSQISKESAHSDKRNVPERSSDRGDDDPVSSSVDALVSTTEVYR